MILVLSTSVGPSQLSCDILGPPRDGGFQGASAVFVGQVRSVKTRISKTPGSAAVWAVKFKVIERFKGVSASHLVVMVGNRCPVTFEIGETYVVWAHMREPGELFTYSFDRDIEVSRCGDEIEWLRRQTLIPAE
jgi:hypothetical protein